MHFPVYRHACAFSGSPPRYSVADVANTSALRAVFTTRAYLRSIRGYAGFVSVVDAECGAEYGEGECV